MPKKINPELRARAVRLVSEHQQEYASATEAMTAVADQVGVAGSRCVSGSPKAEFDAGDRPA